MTMGNLLGKLSPGSARFYICICSSQQFVLPTGNDSETSDIHYLQSQNGNIYTNLYFNSKEEDSSEFESLRKDIPSEIPWCSEALGPTWFVCYWDDIQFGESQVGRQMQ